VNQVTATVLAEMLTGSASGIGRLMINRPEKKNAIDPATARALTRGVREFGADPGCVGIMLCGAGGDLSSGADLDAPRPSGEPSPRWRDSPSSALLAAVAHSPVPVAAVIDGWAAGLGVGLAGAATFALAGAGARFVLPESKLGFFPFGVVPYLARRVRPERVLEWSLSAEPVPVSAARAAGLVTHEAPAGEAEDAARALLAGFRAAGPDVTRQGMAWIRTCDPELAAAASWCGEQLDAARGRGPDTAAPGAIRGGKG
jgi:enoyl-CoA hydratase/carnithine racemase